ncbi:hypothetical protein C8R46DRAFT_1046559 [Mycena filopes]|nr:hypothetical protein C8R46DRAFT_1046559 [Mycena filopes]
MQCEFMWNGSKSSPVSRDTLLAPIAEGGKNLFDLEARNEALQIMKLKSYLELDPERRAAWAAVADATIERNDKLTSNVAPGSHVNTFLQSWAPKRSGLPTRLKDMINTGVKYGLVFDTPEPSVDLRKKLPLWHPFSEDRTKRRINNTTPCKCLRHNHRVFNVGDAIRAAERLGNPDHITDKTCMCYDCVEDRNFKNCKNPHSCAKMARQKIDSLVPKWNPSTDYPDRQVAEETEGDSHSHTFTGPQEISTLTDGFRIFTRDKTEAEAYLPIASLRDRIPGNQVIVSVAGVARNAGTADAIAGSGGWFGHDLQNISLRLPEDTPQTASNAEVIATIGSLKQAGKQTEVIIGSGSRKMMTTLKTNLPKWEDRGWIGVPERRPIQALVAELRGRIAKTTFTVVEESEGKEEAANLAAGSEKLIPGIFDLRTPPQTQHRGAKLSTLTQSSAYRGIRELKKHPNRKTTDEIIEITQDAVKQVYGSRPTAAAIWKSIRNRDISRQVRNFWWKTLHGAHRIGKFWLHIPEMDDRANCQHCGVLETMEHILVECPRPGRAEVWALAEKLWAQKHPNWPQISLGSILGAGLATFKNENGKTLPNTARLYRILISESMYLIWKLRCEVVIAEAGVAKSATEIHNRWVAIMNERLEIDRTLTNRARFGKVYSLAPSMVLDTWKGTLQDEEKLPDRWLSEPEVLVGIAPIRSLRSPSSPVGRRGRNK